MRALLVLTALLAGLLVGVPAAADPVPPDDQPLPGYTVVEPDLEPLTTPDGPTELLTGINRHALFVIEVPPNWNGELVMWAHGFRGNQAELEVDEPPFGLRERWISQGFAWAASSYDRNGYDIASGVESTRALVDRFSTEVYPPVRVYLAGASMGGHVVARSIEQYRDLYAGALPMCGVLGDRELFDFFLDFSVSAQALSGQAGNYPPGPDYETAVLPGIYAGLGLAPGDPSVSTPEAEQLRAAAVLDSGGVRPGAGAAFSYWKDFLLELPIPSDEPSPVTGVAATPGAVATNIGTDYAPDAPVDLDAVVQRVPAADPATRESTALTPVAQVGEPTVPVLSLHGLGDLFVPFAMEQAYAATADPDLLVQRAIRTVGHCEFSAVEAGTAWDDLVAWVDHGVRPAGDPVTDPAAVADPAFGCAFSDRAAYDNAGPVGADETRPLFEPCPVG